MFALRCTQKLLDRLRATPIAHPSPSETVLGDWYANLVRAGRRQMILAVSERTLLPVVMPAKGTDDVFPRLCSAQESVLLAIGVSAQDAAVECEAMRHAVFAKTANRRVLGLLNDLVFQLQTALDRDPNQSALDVSLWLAGTPMSFLEYGFPDRATVAAFEANRALIKARRRSDPA